MPGLDPDSPLDVVRRRIAAAAARAGRSAETVTLVAVSKTVSADGVRPTIALGQREFGENRVQEGLEKIAALSDPRLVWHLIGHLQSNKAARAARAFAWIQSIDTREILTRVDRAAQEAGLRPRVLIQVDLAHEATKSGADASEIDDLVRAALDARAVELRGLMIIPPATPDVEDARPWFRRLRELRDRLVADGAPASSLSDLSMGMSHDFEVAIEEGATFVRVGTAIFGSRPAAPGGG